MSIYEIDVRYGFGVRKVEKSATMYEIGCKPCPFCHAKQEWVYIGGDDLYTYNMAYATMSQILTRLRHAPEVRERFVSGTCADCWEATFSPIGGK
jgi:hypothetical protein